jgi:anti-sigma factor RsiW
VTAIFGRRRRALVCRDAVALMTDYIEGRLSADDIARLEGHLAGCRHCTEYLAQIRITIDALGYVTPQDLSDDAVNDLVDLYRRWHSEE